MSKDLRFHLTDEQWQGILFQLRNARIGELEEEIERLKGKLAETAGARDHAYKLLDKEGIEVARLTLIVNRRIGELEAEVERLGREKKRLQWEAGQEDRVEELEREVERLRTDVARWKHSNDNWKKEVERLKGRETLAGFLTTTLRKAAEGTPLEFPKKCGCGASVRAVPTHEFPWNCKPVGCLTRPMRDSWHCIVCGEELKA